MPEKQPRGRPPTLPQDMIGELIREGHSRRSAYNHAYCSIALAALAGGLAKGGGLMWRYPELAYYAKPRFKVTLLAEIGRLIVGGGHPDVILLLALKLATDRRTVRGKLADIFLARAALAAKGWAGITTKHDETHHGYENNLLDFFSSKPKRIG